MCLSMSPYFFYSEKFQVSSSLEKGHCLASPPSSLKVFSFFLGKATVWPWHSPSIHYFFTTVRLLATDAACSYICFTEGFLGLSGCHLKQNQNIPKLGLLHSVSLNFGQSVTKQSQHKWSQKENLADFFVFACILVARKCALPPPPPRRCTTYMNCV